MTCTHNWDYLLYTNELSFFVVMVEHSTFEFSAVGAKVVSSIPHMAEIHFSHTNFILQIMHEV